MAFYRWKFRQFNKEKALNLAEELEIDEFSALLATARGYEEPEELEEFLSDEAFLNDYTYLKDLLPAAERIKEAVNNKEHITIFGDYDCDGITATALLYTFLKQMGAVVDYYIPNRQDEGYGISINSLAMLKNKGTELIITVDNGISAIKEIEYANSLGVTVIVTDHHLPGEVLPNAFCVIDPKRQDDIFPFKELAGVGVAYYLACAIADSEPEELLENYSHLVCIGTVADVCPIINDNRTFVKAGLKAINSKKITNISALLNAAAAKEGQITASDIGFIIAPRLNASGRIDSADLALSLLLENNQEKAYNIANKLNQKNIERQNIEGGIVEQAKELIINNGYNYDRVIVAASSGWHEGVIGIAAAKLAEFFGKPCILLNIKGDIAVGSARSITGFSLFDALYNAKELLLKFGGHKKAAGLTIETSKIEEFRAFVNNYAKGFLRPTEELLIDCKLNPAAISCELISSFKIFEPFGVENPTPIFALMNMQIKRIEALSAGKHVKIIAQKNGAFYKLLLFNCNFNKFMFNIDDFIDVAVQLSVSYFNNKAEVSIIIKDIRKSGFNEEEHINNLDLLDRFNKKEYNNKDAEQLLLSREDIGLVYKEIKTKANKLKIINTLKTLSMAQIEIAILILLELGIIEKTEEEALEYKLTNIKSDLADSSILKEIQQRRVQND